MIKGTHPIVKLLEEHPEWTFVPVGSRFTLIGTHGDPIDPETADYDFFLTTPKGDIFTAKKERSAWLVEQGFKEVLVGGYAADHRAAHFRWKAREGFPTVDVLILNEVEAEFRLRLFRVFRKKRRDRDAQSLYRALKGKWPSLWRVLHDFESGPLGAPAAPQPKK